MKKMLPYCFASLLFALQTLAQTPEEKLKALHIELPSVKAPVASYVHLVRTGNLLYLSGKGPSDANGHSITGKVGRDLTVEEGQKAARSVAISAPRGFLSLTPIPTLAPKPIPGAAAGYQ